MCLVPRVYFLLPSKHAVVYQWALNRLLQTMEQAGVVVVWTEVALDFEASTIAAIRQINGGANLRLLGCHFHYCAAIYKKLTTAPVLLAQQYKDDPDLRFFMEVLYALPFIPQDRVVNVFAAVVQQFQPPNLVHHAGFQAFLVYYEQQWVQNAELRAMANVYGRDRRTNNDLEGWHLKLLALMRNHPTLYKFIHQLRELHALDVHNQEEIASGRYAGRLRTPKMREREDRLYGLWQMYVAGGNYETDLHYLVAVAQEL
jgi:hypothetical protein